MADTPEPQRAIVENVDMVARLEAAANLARTPGERVAARVAGFVGTMPFVVLHLVAIAAWVVLNAGWTRAIGIFDPYPFSILNLAVSTEAVLLSAIVLISQNRLSVLSERRAHLDLQVNLLTETEVTRVLRLVRRIAEKHDIHDDDHERVVELSEPTEIDDLVAELDRKVTGERM